MRLAAAIAVVTATAGLGQALPPEACLVRRGEPPAVSFEWGGRTWEFARVECRELFFEDPERYAQLFEALDELERAGELDPDPPPAASLVPN